MRESTDRADPDVSVLAPQPRRPQPFATGLVALALTALLFMASLAGLIGVGPAPALALNDAQAEVVEVWRLVNQSYVDPARLEAVQWRRLRLKTLE